ncbi:MAG: magnesium transporter [Planctomycetes bacterium]|nr:magnesium transporter [Planctomycetota bacterium]
MSAAEPLEETPKNPREDLREAISNALKGPHAGLVKVVESVHEADLAAVMLDLSEREAWLVFDALKKERRAGVLAQAEDALREDLLEQLTPRQLARIVQVMAPDDVVDLLALVEPEYADRVLHSVDFELAADLRELASHGPETAGGLMTTEFVAVPQGTRIGDSIKLLKQEADENSEGVGLFVVDEEQRPIGYVTDRSLLTNSIHDVVDDVMTEAKTVAVTQDQEEVANELTHYSLQEIAVVDDAGKLVGVVSFDDAQDVLEEEASEDIFKIIGTSAKLQTRLPIHSRVLARLPLQGVTVLGGLTTAYIIEQVMRKSTGGEISTGADILRFVPIVIGLAGNVGSQASTILVRGFATGEVEPDREVSVLRSEVLVGLCIGLICGLVTFLVIGAIDKGQAPFHFSLAIGIAILAAVTWAAVLGCVVPMSCRRIGIDPAVVAGPFLVAVSDVSGTGLYLAVASLMLGH